MKPQAFVFIGKSGSGKGTQADLLTKYLEGESDTPIFKSEVGKALRAIANSDNDNYSVSRIKEMMEDGKLAPAFLSIWVWGGELVEKADGNQHLIFDGTPRKLSEAMILATAMHFYCDSKPHIIHIDVSDDWSNDRLTARGRSDDNPDDIRERLDWFAEDVVPAIQYYKGDPESFNYHKINGEQSIEEVHQEIISKISGAN